jgi:hypothetical protein
MTDRAPDQVIALAVAELLATRPAWRGRADREPGLWEVVVPVPHHPGHRATGALLLVAAAADGARVHLSLSLRLTRPALAARWRALLDQRDLRAGNADLDLGLVPESRAPVLALLEAVRRADPGIPATALAAGFDPTRGRWFGEPIGGDAWVLGHELTVVPQPATAGLARAALAAYVAGVLPRLLP